MACAETEGTKMFGSEEQFMFSSGNNIKITLSVDLDAWQGRDRELPCGNWALDKENSVNGLVISTREGFKAKQVADDELRCADRNHDNSLIPVPRTRPADWITEKEGDIYVSDLVWAKVRSHPWWPGQILEPAAISEKAMKCVKKDSYLIAYFGDQTFAWNKASQIKPFMMYFSQMENQSKAESFCQAVKSALDEVSRRVEFGLSCSCLLEETRNKIKSQVICNAGITEESCNRYGGDVIYGATLFEPSELLLYLKSIAAAPCCKTDRLKYVISRAQLLSFNRWKGSCLLPITEELHGLESRVDRPLILEQKNLIGVMKGESCFKQYKKGTSREEESTASRRSFEKHNCWHVDNKQVNREKLIADLMAESLANGESKSKREVDGRTAISTSIWKHEEMDGVARDSNRKRRRRRGLKPSSIKDYVVSRPKKFVKIGECFQRAEDQHGILTNMNDIVITKVDGVASRHSRKLQRGIVTPPESPPPGEILSRLLLAAKDPFKQCDLLSSIATVLADFRNSRRLANSSSLNNNGSSKSDGDKEASSTLTDYFEFDGMEDSYWKDRIIQSNSQDQVLFDPKTQTEEETAVCMDTNPVDNLEDRAVVQPSAAESPSSPVDETCEGYSPTALTLKFADLENIPSVANLNNIFNHYGPVIEVRTEILVKNKAARVVFKRRSDAETAFSSSGKFSVFGPSLLSYRLRHSPAPRKASHPASRKKEDTSVRGHAA